VLQHRWGRDALAFVLRLTGVDDEQFSTNSSVNSHQQGQRAVGLVLRRTLRDLSLDHVHAMEKEAAEDTIEGE
jgi:hypothetical protein